MRKEHWQREFWSALDEHRKQAFKYGQRDCVLFAASMADTISVNGNYVSRARQAFEWTNTREALALTSGGLQPLVETVLGPAIKWTFLGQGDVVLIVDDDGAEGLAVHDGAQIIGPDAVGVKVIPFRCARVGWKIP